MDLRARRDTYNGFGEGLAQAFELAVTPAIFAGIGYAIDRWLGIVPVVTIVLLLLALVGMFLRMWYEYDAKMKRLEGEGKWARKAAPTVPGTAATAQAPQV